MLRRVAFPLSLAVAGHAAASLPAAPTRAAAPVQSPNFPNGPYYAIGCAFSHRNNDDPWSSRVSPASRTSHTYIGNRSVTAVSTAASLVGGQSTCESEFDSSAYWMPTLFVGQDDITPLTSIVCDVNRSPRANRSAAQGD